MNAPQLDAGAGNCVGSNLFGGIRSQVAAYHGIQLPVDLLAQLVEHCTGIAEVIGSNPVQS